MIETIALISIGFAAGFLVGFFVGYVIGIRTLISEVMRSAEAGEEKTEGERPRSAAPV